MQAPIIPSGLPEPDDESARHSRMVQDFILERIRDSGGAIPFGEFMHYALYAPGLGYYVSGSRKFADGGDFVTAPEVSSLFGRVIARQCAPVLAACGTAELLELGAGSGALAVDVLSRLAELGSLPDRYLILEVSADLAERQRQRIRQALPSLAGRIQWIDGLPSAFEGVMLANEVADALPVERFRVTTDGIEQCFVAASGDELACLWGPATKAVVAGVDALDAELPPGYVSEISLGLKPWTASLVDALRHGVALLFDYGLSRREYYAPDRGQGWLRCHFRHHAHSEPLILPGIQDITAWVDFTSVAEAATDRGADVAGYVTQAMFLLCGGVENDYSALATDDERQSLALAAGLKRLTLPGEMGENFKCIGLSKGKVPVLSALADADRSAAL